jgi:hypothetical protein
VRGFYGTKCVAKGTSPGLPFRESGARRVKSDEAPLNQRCVADSLPIGWGRGARWGISPFKTQKYLLKPCWCALRFAGCSLATAIVFMAHGVPLSARTVPETDAGQFMVCVRNHRIAVERTEQPIAVTESDSAGHPATSGKSSSPHRRAVRLAGGLHPNSGPSDAFAPSSFPQHNGPRSTTWMNLKNCRANLPARFSSTPAA